MARDAVLGRAVRVVVCLMTTLGFAACGGGGGGDSPTTSTPPPSTVTLTSLAPAALNAGTTATVLTTTGAGFTSTSVIEWNGAALTTSYVSATSLTATIPAADLTTPSTVAITVSNAASGGASSAVVDFTISEQAAPTIGTLAPNAVTAGSQAFSLVVTGTNFQPTASVFWNGNALPTQFDSATQVVGQVSSAQLAAAGSAAVTVVNDSAAGGTSNVVQLTIAAPSPLTLTSVAPAALNAGASATVLTATGTGFTSTSVIKWNGTALTTSYVSATSLTANIPAGDLATPGTVAVTVSDTAAGGASSAVVNFTIGEQTAPTIATLAPNTAIAGAPTILLVVTGANFQPTATVFWNGSALATGFDSATQVVAHVSSAQLATAGSAAVTVVNDSAAGGTSNVMTFTIASPPPAPTLTSLSPTSIRQNQGNVTLTLTGTHFTPTTQVSYTGLGSAQTTYVSPTQLSFTFTTSLYSPSPGSTVNISVIDPASGNVASNALPLAVTAATPITSSISPSSVFADQGAIALTVTGQFFTPTSIVYVNGNARPTTLNNGQLIAQLTALDVTTVGSAAITVEDSASGNVASNPATLTVKPLPSLLLSSLSPTTVPAGNGPFTLTAVGNGFSTQSAITWNGAPLPTTHVSVTVLTASVTAAQVASVGTIQVAVANPANEGGASGALSLSIVAPSIDAVSYQIDNGHRGSITFQSASLPSVPAWSVNLGGAPSFAVIVSNRVYVMANNNGNSQLFALDGATGTRIWGPTAFSGAAGITYDNGMLFINSGSYISNGVLTALDATTGAMKWSATIPGGFATQSPPVASQGIVYILEDGELTAYSETTGAQVWQQYSTGTNGSVAVTVDGVYTAAPCTPMAFRPLTGAVIWSANTGCEGGGGNTPVVGSGRVYAPISPGGYGGNVYDAESGAILNAFNYSVAPAISATHAYVMYNSTLQGITLSNDQINWSFAGDGMLVTSPIVVNNYVFVGSSSGNLYGLDATTGSLLWTQNLGAAIPYPETGGNALQGYSGLSAGDGLLVVPAGNTITAYVLSTNP